jgi:hypothetical protein
MALTTPDATARAAWVAATSQTTQLEGLRDAIGSAPRFAVLDGSGELARVTVPTPTINTETDPYQLEITGFVPGSHVHTATGNPVTAEVRTSGGTVILRADAGLADSGATVEFAGAVKERCPPSAALVVRADDSLPAVNPNARISFWGQSNAEGSALRSGIADITADAELVDWDDGTLTFDRVMFWNTSTSVYAEYVPGSNHGTLSTLLGPEFGMAVRWMRETTTGVLYMDKNAFGGTSITSFEPPSATRWTTGISRRASQDAWLSSNGVTIDPSRTFWLWSQAEADSGQNQAWYEPKMQAIVDELRSNGILPFRGVLTDIPTGSGRYNAGISAAKQAVADTTDGLVVKQIEPAFPTFFEDDNLHLNARGQVQRSFTAYSFFFDAETITV